MSRLLIAVSLAALLLSYGSWAQAQEGERKKVMAALKVGQVVVLKETAGRFELTLMKDVVVGHKVIEVGDDYVLVEDAAGVTETFIPVYSIKSIVVIKPPKK